MNSDIVAYYRERAEEYDKVYQKLDRQEDLRRAEVIFRQVFSGKEVFEIACGTGYWTEKIATVAKKVIATDINESVIHVAQSKHYPPGKVEFRIADLFNMDPSEKYESLFGGFIWSHIRLEDLNRFIDSANSVVKPGGILVFMDNKHIEGSNLPIIETDAAGNTYQQRKLDNGTLYKVLKNFATEELMRKVLQGKATDIEVTELQYYWVLKYRRL